jgi:hypothetical protein
LFPRRACTAESDSEAPLPNPSAALHSDAWDGYPATFHSLLALIAEVQPRNLVFLSGDEHLSCIATIHIASSGKSPVVIHSIHSSALYAPFPFANGVVENLLETDNFSFRSARNDAVIGCTAKTVFAPSGDGFALISCTQVSEDQPWVLKIAFDRAVEPEPYELRMLPSDRANH